MKIVWFKIKAKRKRGKEKNPREMKLRDIAWKRKTGKERGRSRMMISHCYLTVDATV